MNENVPEAIQLILQEKLEALDVNVVDESGRHAGHAGSGGGGHYRVRVVSSRFQNLSRIDRHRAIYEALGGSLGAQIHALAILALTPEEAQKPPLI